MRDVDSYPTHRIVEAIIRDLGNGAVLDYYTSQPWEAPLRNDFADLVSAFRAGNVPAIEDVRGILRRLNYGYRTRYPLSSLDHFGEVVLGIADSRSWWNRMPPGLLGSSDQESAELSPAPAEIIRVMKKGNHKRPYSLSTKCLHFLFPNSFAICDQQSAESVQMWAYFAFTSRDEDWRRFSWQNLTDMNGEGYDGMLDFYRHLWNTATEAEQAEIVDGACAISSRIGGLVTPIDVIDKVLWRANGDPAVLGFSLA